jgi:predicted nucleotidyltransferase
MLKNTIINKKVIKKIAIALDDLNEQVVYVGGAIVSLYINDSAADDLRPTKDIDICMSIASLGELESLRQKLAQKGFKQSAEDNVICRFRYESILVDVMNTKAVGWAPANPWFADGFELRQQVEIENQKIQILPLSYFLASKFAAFNDRGAKDPRTSHDFEDIVYILDNRMDFEKEIFKDSRDNVKKYLQNEFKEIVQNDLKQEAILSNLYYENRDYRFRKIIEKLNLAINDI